jgi:uncharacterized protein (DUF2249 family)
VSASRMTSGAHDRGDCHLPRLKDLDRGNALAIDVDHVPSPLARRCQILLVEAGLHDLHLGVRGSDDAKGLLGRAA